MTKREMFAAALFCFSVLGLVAWGFQREHQYQRTRKDLESQLQTQRRVIGTLQRSLLQRLQDFDSVGLRIEDIPNAEILADKIFTPESDRWDYLARSYDGPRDGVLRAFYYGLDERPPAEHVATYFIVYTLNGEITDINEVSPLY